MRGRGLYLGGLGRLQVLEVVLCRVDTAALGVTGLYDAVKGRRDVISSIWVWEIPWKLR